MTIRKAALACGGELRGEGDFARELGRAVIDSRAVQPGDLFAAYCGERVDGHNYIAAAFDRGAACCLAERVPEGETRPILLVESVQKALEQIAAAYRATLSLPVVGITGSVGKTSAKEMIASVLSQRLRVLKTEGNLNNQIGVPMTVSRITREHEAAVVEMGISGFGEMTELARIARPTAAVYTVIGSAHLEFLHDRDGVLRAKSEMLDEMDADAPVFVNGDDDKLRALRCRQKKILFGLGEHNDLRAEKLRLLPDGGTACELVAGERRIAVEIHAFGRHMVYAALAGAAVGMAFGLTDEEIAAGVAAYQTVGRRAAVTDTGCLTLIDDCYNANPDSCRCGVDSLLQLPGRPVCIFGDMLELGEDAPAMHAAIGQYAKEKGVALTLCCGPLSEETAKAAEGLHYVNREALVADLPRQLRKGDAVLVKASRGMHFEEIAEALKRLKLE
ncbi:MAG: UDP-N-acetylmuramoyl-tripeptide--D-alanyl-D-alanine ligase [Clostridia bacterium]